MMTVDNSSAALTAIELAMELSIHAQELGRDLPVQRSKYIQAFYNFITADTPQSYDVRVTALRTKLSSTKTEMSGEFRTQLNHTHIELVDNVEKQVLSLKGVSPHKIASKHSKFDLPNIGINDEMLQPKVFIQHTQAIANKIEQLMAAVANNDWNAVEDIDQNYVGKSTQESSFSSSVKNHREKNSGSDGSSKNTYTK